MQRDGSELEVVSEMDAQGVKDKLREILNSFFSGTSSHTACSKQSQAMTVLLSNMKETDGRVLAAADSCPLSEIFSVALAVEIFSCHERAEEKRQTINHQWEKLFCQLKKRS